VKVRLTFDFDDNFRRALASQYGGKGLADRETLIGWIHSCIDSTAHDVTAEYQQEQEGEKQ